MVDTIEASRQQFTHVFHQHRREVLRFLTSKVSNAHDAEDVMQDLFIKISELDKRASLNIENPKNYLFKIANNMAIDHLRNKSRQNAYLFDAKTTDIDNPLVAASSPDRILDGQQQADLLRIALSAMPARRRQVFLLFKYRNLTRAEIAVELNLSIVAVEKHLVRALKNCRDALQRGDVND